MKKLGYMGLLLLVLSPLAFASTWSGWYPSQSQASNAALNGCRAYYRLPCVVKYCEVSHGYAKRWRCEANRIKPKRWDRGRDRDRGRDDRGRGRGRDDHGYGHY